MNLHLLSYYRLDDEDSGERCGYYACNVEHEIEYVSAAVCGNHRLGYLQRSAEKCRPYYCSPKEFATHNVGVAAVIFEPQDYAEPEIHHEMCQFVKMGEHLGQFFSVGLVKGKE